MKKTVIVAVAVLMSVVLHGMGSTRGIEAEEAGKIAPAASPVDNDPQMRNKENNADDRPLPVSGTGKHHESGIKEKRERVKITRNKEGIQDLLEFYGPDGKKTKEIKIGRRQIKAQAKDKHGKTRNDAQLFEDKMAVVSEDGNRTAVAAYSKMYFGELKKSEITGGYYEEENESVLELEAYDEEGRLKWKNKVGENINASSTNSVLYGESGHVVVKISADTDDTDDAIIVYDSTGKKVLSYPKEKEYLVSINDYKISPNGKYLGMRRRILGGIDSVIFFNLSNGRSWDMGEIWGVGSVANNGQVELYSGLEQKFINLKEKIGD